MNRVVHFEFGAVEPARAAEFYRQVFHWEITNWPGPQEYYLVTTGPNDQPGINGGIMRHEDGQPRTVNTVEVESLEQCAARVRQHGGTVVVERQVIPGVGYQMYCRDTEGNLFGVHQADPNAQA
jgi:hypothetical protein